MKSSSFALNHQVLNGTGFAPKVKKQSLFGYKSALFVEDFEGKTVNRIVI